MNVAAFRHKLTIIGVQEQEKLIICVKWNNIAQSRVEIGAKGTLHL